MKTGESLQDAQGTNWTIGQELGRGLWGRSWLVRDPNGRERVLKVALDASDFPSDAPSDLAGICRTCLTEQRDLLQGGAISWLPHLEGTLTLPDGHEGLLLPRYSSSLQRRLTTGTGLGRVLELVSTVCRDLASTGAVHANLHPGNILISEDGRPLLSDLLTSTAQDRRADLTRYAPGRASGWFPPEAGGAPTPEWDTWALCQTLYVTALTQPDGGTGRSGLPAATAGIDKIQLASLRDAALARLRVESANARFVGRVAEKLGSLLNRGLSLTHEPSPPYRFRKTTDLQPRLEEVASLVAPRIESVGKVLLSSNSTSGVFEGGEPVSLSVSITCSSGAVAHEDLVVGFRIIDLDDPEQTRIAVDEARYEVKAHPSGRIRFDFDLPNITPGRYTIRVAFGVKDSGREPVTSEGQFEVRPPPGYVPPPSDLPSPSPLTMPSRPEPAEDAVALSSPGDVVTFPGAPSPSGPATDASDPGFYPEPVAPPTSPEPSQPEVPKHSTLVPPTNPVPTTNPVPVAPTPEPAAPAAPTPSWQGGGPGTWEAELPSPEPTYEETVGDSALPGNFGDDLPSWEASGANPVDQFLDFIRKNTALAFIGIVLVIVAGLFCMGLSINICF